ncbi:MAG TPA: DUF885 domain-containing protein [Casimicrobiaceae bacterium]
MRLTRNRFHRLLAIALSALALAAPFARAAAPQWVEQSNEFASIPLAVFARYFPEYAGQVGVDGIDREIFDLRPEVYERYLADTRKAAESLRGKLPGAADSRVRQDLEIMIKAQEDFATTAQLRRRLLLEHIDVAQIEFTGIRVLLDPQISKERQPTALVRLRRYAGLEQGFVPLARLAIDRTQERLAVVGLTGPYVNEVNKALDDSKHYVDGIRDLFRASGLEGWQEPLAALEAQVRDYDAWVRANVLPKCRTTPQLPREVYADNLKVAGVDVAPELLIAQAQFSYAEIQNQLRGIAAQIARQRGFRSTDYRDVIRELKKEQLVGAAILPFFSARLTEMEGIIVREHIVTLPDRKAVIRLATAAETAQTPAAHMTPPRLIGNTGEYGEFVLPLSLPGEATDESLRIDDDTTDAASWTIIAHEARPGHELQFASMVERGVSIARAVYAFNTVNLEGWALYAEAEMQSYEPLEGQLFALQWRMVRAARAFIDPMINLGMMTPDRAAAVLRDDLAISKAMVKQEIDRYTFWAPGQAPSYYYGYMRLMQLRAQTELALGTRFDRKRFNDFVLGQGLLPPPLMQRAVETEFVPRERGASTDADGATVPAAAAPAS